MPGLWHFDAAVSLSRAGQGRSAHQEENRVRELQRKLSSTALAPQGAPANAQPEDSAMTADQAIKAALDNQSKPEVAMMYARLATALETQQIAVQLWWIATLLEAAFVVFIVIVILRALK